jgi:hypothetical protein
MDAVNTEALGDFDKHGAIVGLHDPLGFRLRCVEREPVDVLIGLADVDEAGGNKRIHKPVQLELANPIRIQFAPFVADHGDLQPGKCRVSDVAAWATRGSAACASDGRSHRGCPPGKGLRG